MTRSPTPDPTTQAAEPPSQRAEPGDLDGAAVHRGHGRPVEPALAAIQLEHVGDARYRAEVASILADTEGA